MKTLPELIEEEAANAASSIVNVYDILPTEHLFIKDRIKCAINNVLIRAPKPPCDVASGKIISEP